LEEQSRQQEKYKGKLQTEVHNEEVHFDTGSGRSGNGTREGGEGKVNRGMREQGLGVK